MLLKKKKSVKIFMNVAMSSQIEILCNLSDYYSQSIEGSCTERIIMKMETILYNIFRFERTFSYLACFEIHSLLSQVKPLKKKKDAKLLTDD